MEKVEEISKYVNILKAIYLGYMLIYGFISPTVPALRRVWGKFFLFGSLKTRVLPLDYTGLALVN